MKDTFKNWLEIKNITPINENIIINDMGSEAVLNVVQPQLIKEFHYQWDEGYSLYFIAAYQAKRPGYISISTSPTHVGITKTDPIEGGKGIDQAFLKTLHSTLNSKYKSVPYKEGESSWSNAFPDHADIFKNAAEKDVNHPKLPDFQQGASNAQKLGKSMSVSRASGSWSFFFRTESPDFAIKAILDYAKQAAKPLIDNDLIDYYEIVDRMTSKRIEVVRSNKGNDAQGQLENEYARGVSYLKYLAELMLKDKPGAKQLVLNRINQVGSKVSGGGEHPALKIQPANNKFPLEELKTFINRTYAEDFILLAFVEAIKKDNQKVYELLDYAGNHQSQTPGTIVYNGVNLLKTYGKFDYGTDLSSWLESSGYLGLRGHFYNLASLFKYSNDLKQIVPNELTKFKTETEEKIDEFLSNPEEEDGDKIELSKSEIKSLVELAKYIHIDEKKLENLNGLHKDILSREAEEKKKEQEYREKAKHLLYHQENKYLALNGGTTTWESVPQKYVSYHDQDVDLGDFALEEIIDREDIAEEAYEKALEKVQGDAEERKSTSYGDDQADVESDIDYHYDDFVNAHEFDDDISQMSDDELIKMVKDDYYDAFVDWRKKELEKEEEEESWKYEPEPDHSDISEAEQELAVPLAFKEYGLVLMKYDDERHEVYVQCAAKWDDKVRQILLKTLQINLSSKTSDDEPHISRSDKIVIDYYDKDQNYVSKVSDFIFGNH